MPANSGCTKRSMFLCYLKTRLILPASLSVLHGQEMSLSRCRGSQLTWCLDRWGAEGRPCLTTTLIISQIHRLCNSSGHKLEMRIFGGSWDHMPISFWRSVLPVRPIDFGPLTEKSLQASVRFCMKSLCLPFSFHFLPFSCSLSFLPSLFSFCFH